MLIKLSKKPAKKSYASQRGLLLYEVLKQARASILSVKTFMNGIKIFNQIVKMLFYSELSDQCIAKVAIRHLL